MPRSKSAAQLLSREAPQATQANAVESVGLAAAGRSAIVAATCDVLRLLGRSDAPLGVNAIARQLSMAPSSCFKILRSLHMEGFVDCDERKAYSMGLGVAGLARRALDPSNAFSVLKAPLDAIAQEQGVAVGLWRLTPRRRIVLIGFCEGPGEMRLHMSPGQRLPRLIGAVGRAIAAGLDLTGEEIRQEFASLAWASAPPLPVYLSDIAHVRETGYAVDWGNFTLGVCSVAATVDDEDGAPHFGISAIMFKDQQHDEAIRRIGQALAAFSKAASLRLGITRAPLSRAG